MLKNLLSTTVEILAILLCIIVELGRLAIAAWSTLDSKKLIAQIEKFDTGVLPNHSIDKQEQRVRAIAPFSAKYKKDFLKEIDTFLRENVLLDLEEPFNSSKNLSILAQLGLESSIGGFDIYEEVSAAGENKLNEDYKFLVRTYRLAEKVYKQYRTALASICKNSKDHHYGQASPSPLHGKLSIASRLSSASIAQTARRQ